MKYLRELKVALGVIVVPIFLVWTYTFIQLHVASSKGVYESPEEGMLTLMDRHYAPDHEIKILYAGANSFDGSKPYIWYVIAEVRASSRADGSAMGRNGCDAPGSFFLQTKEGWVFVPEGAFPEFIGFWMKVFGMAGPGRSAPSTDWATDQNRRFCQ